MEPVTEGGVTLLYSAFQRNKWRQICNRILAKPDTPDYLVSVTKNALRQLDAGRVLSHKMRVALAHSYDPLKCYACNRQAIYKVGITGFCNVHKDEAVKRRGDNVKTFMSLTAPKVLARVDYDNRDAQRRQANASRKAVRKRKK